MIAERIAACLLFLTVLVGGVACQSPAAPAEHSTPRPAEHVTPRPAASATPSPWARSGPRQAERVTLAEIAADPARYYDRAIRVAGDFEITFSHAAPACVAPPFTGTPELRPTYMPLKSSTWTLVDHGVELARIIHGGPKSRSERRARRDQRAAPG